MRIGRPARRADVATGRSHITSPASRVIFTSFRVLGPVVVWHGSSSSRRRRSPATTRRRRSPATTRRRKRSSGLRRRVQAFSSTWLCAVEPPSYYDTGRVSELAAASQARSSRHRLPEEWKKNWARSSREAEKCQQKPVTKRGSPSIQILAGLGENCRQSKNSASHPRVVLPSKQNSPMSVHLTAGLQSV